MDELETERKPARRVPKRIPKSLGIKVLTILLSLTLSLICTPPLYYLVVFVGQVSGYYYFFAPSLSLIPLLILCVVPIILTIAFYFLFSWLYDDLQEQYIRVSKEAMARAINDKG